ncbi:MAG: (Na+)-NQR maturation NqrM [SAR86 cluster bacterium]|jgi:hypothetical protein|nr:hypothetical protein [Gammaproteobacteria bacterium]RCL35976.1 MAG: (Na+)-NQR maturation NqrM [SAR86 cluster bacterium]URQ68985.1 (Na+)-NQR maturation NqrM [SAR86 cluster bacterium]
MNTFLISFVVILISFGALSIGLILRNKPISGSCGGIMNSDDGKCNICGKTELESCAKTDS